MRLERFFELASGLNFKSLDPRSSNYRLGESRLGACQDKYRISVKIRGRYNRNISSLLGIMYHQNRHSLSLRDKDIRPVSGKKNWMLGLAIASLLLSATAPYCQASPSRLTSPAVDHEATLAAQSVSEHFECIPAGKRLKHRPTDVKIYEYDREPLGDRSPFLMVHGLRGEYLPYFRWQKVSEKLTKNPDFNARYKIYMVRYSTLDRIESTLPKFKEALNSLYEMGQKRPISMLALSMGGNLSYEAFTDKEIEPKIKLLFTMGTPFHGSPLFCSDWLAYTIYKRLSWPWSRIDHNLGTKLYFRKNPGLQEDLMWDNADDAIPNVGHFWSKLPFGPSGKLTVLNTMNERLAKVNSIETPRNKLITYGGYIVNPYMAPRAKRYVESAFMYPLFLISTTFPAHCAREHPVLDMLNRDIANVQVPKSVAKIAGTPFAYVLNDGITPISSAIFLPPDIAKQNYMARESDIEKLNGKLDVGLARVFRNVDHLTFIDGVRPVNPIQAAYKTAVKDELNPKEAPREIFDWMLSDILASDAITGKLAKRIQTKESDKEVEIGEADPKASCAPVTNR